MKQILIDCNYSIIKKTAAAFNFSLVCQAVMYNTFCFNQLCCGGKGRVCGK